PPQPGYAVCHGRPARAGPHRVIHGHRDVHVDGHDVLAPADRSGTGAGGRTLMDFTALRTQVIALLQREQPLSYRALTRQFALEDEDLEALKDELIYAKKLAVDEDNRVLVWAGEHASAAAPPPVPETPALASSPAPDQAREPLAYTPKHLAEKILT